jgi:hypothetical protein
MTVELIKDRDIWDGFVDESSYGSICHKWDFLHIIEKYTGHTLYRYGVYKNEALMAVMPVFVNKIHGLTTVSSPPPQTAVPSLGPVLYKDFIHQKQNKKETQLTMVVEELNAIMEELSPNWLFVSLVPEFRDIRPFIRWNNYSYDIRFYYLIDTRRPIDEIYMGFTNRLRRSLNKAESLDLRVEKSDDASPLYEQLQKSYDRQQRRIPIPNADYLNELLRTFPDELGAYYLYNSDEVMIGATIVQEYKRLVGWIGIPKFDEISYGNEYLIWKMIEKAKTENYRWFEFVGAGTRNLHPFMAKYNPSLEMAFEVYKQDIFGKGATWLYKTLYK